MALRGDPITVHCDKCGHERELCSTPVAIDVFAAVCKLPCAKCGSKKHLRVGPKPKPTADGDAIGWLSNGDTGISSETIWSVMMGRPVKERHWNMPRDPDDFGRCYRLLKIMPSWRERLPEVSAKFPGWKPLVDAWDELTALYEQEVPNHHGRAPKLYERMQVLLERDRAVAR